MSLFNPRATMDVVQFDERHFCLVVDNALLDPERAVQVAIDRRADFGPVDFSLYPGSYLEAPPELTRSLADFFQFHARQRFDARRCLQTTCRYSLVTKAAAELHPLQWLCHRDDVGLHPGLSMQASVLYLFRDPHLGGTAFYAPTRPDTETAGLFSDARQLAPAQFAGKYGLKPDYMRQGNTWFRRLGSVDATWNRLIIYDGGMLHTGDIILPERLSTDPRVGRLTVNGFFTSRRHVGDSGRERNFFSR